MQYCSNCGAELKEDSVFCEVCGANKTRSLVIPYHLQL